MSRYQKGITNLDFTEARDSEWQWHQLGHMQVCTSLQTYNHASTPPLSFLQAGCPSCRPTNSIKALKASVLEVTFIFIYWYDTLILTILHYIVSIQCQNGLILQIQRVACITLLIIRSCHPLKCKSTLGKNVDML